MHLGPFGLHQALQGDLDELERFLVIIGVGCPEPGVEACPGFTFIRAAGIR
jgi:hypothetical protein